MKYSWKFVFSKYFQKIILKILKWHKYNIAKQIQYIDTTTNFQMKYKLAKQIPPLSLYEIINRKPLNTIKLFIILHVFFITYTYFEKGL